MNNYLRDVLSELVSEASKLKDEASSEFDQGKLFGYYEVISKLLNRAESYGFAESLPIELRDYQPECLLDHLS